MGFEPQKFFIGLIDFFSILMPGALLTYLLQDCLGPYVLGDRYAELFGDEAWLVFLFASYLLGHFLYLIGAALLDWLYDVLVGAARDTRVERLAEGKHPHTPGLQRFAKFVLRCFFLKVGGGGLAETRRIKERYLDPFDASSAVNTFQWCKVRLAFEKPDALATVQRLEADSKFFRSFAVALCILIVYWLLPPAKLTALGGVVALWLSLWRYAEQRVKATQQAYRSIITLEAGITPLRDFADSATHAGGVVYRETETRREYLLVRPTRDSAKLLLPKGHIEARESAREAAVREVWEEAGLWARVREELGTLTFSAYEPVRARIFLMEQVKESLADKVAEGNAQKSPAVERTHVPQWMTLEEAIASASYVETKALLQRCRFIGADGH